MSRMPNAVPVLVHMTIEEDSFWKRREEKKKEKKRRFDRLRRGVICGHVATPTGDFSFPSVSAGPQIAQIKHKTERFRLSPTEWFRQFEWCRLRILRHSAGVAGAQ